MTNKEYAKMADIDLINLCIERDVNAPIDDHGKIIRKAVYQILKKWDAEHAHLTRVDRKVRVKFHKSGSDTAMPFVYVSVNGRSTQIPYDMEVVIPESTLKVLNDCVMTTYRGRLNNSNGEYEFAEENIHRFPNTVLGYVEETETKAD